MHWFSCRSILFASRCITLYVKEVYLQAQEWATHCEEIGDGNFDKANSKTKGKTHPGLDGVCVVRTQCLGI